MPSTYSSNLKIELMSTGENSGTWGNITNTNLGTALEQAVVGYGAVSYASDANLTISITNSNAAQAARALVLNVTSAVSLTGTRELVVPTIEKQYIVQNNTTGSQSITVKTSAGTGITVPNGRKAHLYVDGTNVIQMFDFVDINGGTIDGTPIGGSSAAAGSFTTLGASGAATFNGAVTLGDAAADLIVFNGTVNSHLLFTDNTYDIGASGATRPRNLFLAGAATIGGNLSVGGTLTLTGGVNLNGNVTVGDNASDTLTINSTITSNLLFTDNTYDIGASGATRPRNLFLAGNATIGGNQTLTGSLTVDSTTDSSSTTTGSIQTDGGLGVAKAAYIGTNLNVAGNTTLGDANTDTLVVNAKVNANLLFTDATYDIGASLANRPRNLYLSSTINAGAGQFTLLTASNSMYFTAATSSDIAGTIYTVPTIQNWSVGAVGSDFQFYPSNIFTGTPTLTLKTNKQVIVGESSTTAAGGASIRLVVTGASSGGIQMYGNASGGSAIVPVAGGGMQFYSYTGAQGSESYVLRGLYNGSGNWALGSSGPGIVSNIGVATYGGIYSDRGATGGATQTLLTLSASSGSDFGQISNAGATWSLGYGSAVDTTDPVLTWTAGKRVGINTAAPNSTLEVSASFADSAIEEVARISRVGGSALYGSNRAAALAFWDQNNATLTAAVAGVRLSPSGDYNGNIALYYNNTGSGNATSVSQLTKAVQFGSYGALFAGASGLLTGTGIAVYSAGYTNLTLQSAGSSYGSLVDFTEGSGNTLLYRMGVNHNSIGTGNFAFSYGTGPTAPSWSVLSSGTFGAGNLNVTDIDGTGNVRFVSNTGVNATPATTGKNQNAALRLRGGDNAVLDMGLNSVNTWIQATDKSGLNNNYYLHLNPNGGVVTINAGASTPSITEGLFLKASSSTTEVFRIQGASSSGLYQAFYNGTTTPLLLGYGATLSAAATNNDGVIRYNGSYNLRVSSNGTQVSYWGSNNLFNAVYGSYADPSLASSGSNGLQIALTASYNDNSSHNIASVQDKAGVLYVRQNGIQAIPFYPNGGGGVAYNWTVLDPDNGTWTYGSPSFSFSDSGSSANTYTVTFNNGSGVVSIQRTAGSAAYNVYVQYFAAA